MPFGVMSVTLKWDTLAVSGMRVKGKASEMNRGGKLG